MIINTTCSILLILFIKWSINGVMFKNLKLRYSFFSFLGLLAFVSLEAPVLASYTQQNSKYFANEIEYLWQEDKPGFSLFEERIQQRLPKYEAAFRKSAHNLDVHWTLIAAISYQESHWNPKAISNTGVRGLMMLTQKTAKEMGIKKRTNPEDSIIGGANYFQKTFDRLPNEIPKLDKIWMTLAAYNLGYMNLDMARDLAKEKNLNSYLWSDVSDCLEDVLINRYAAESDEFVMYEEVMRYVQRIDLYYKTLSIMDRGDELFLLAKK